MKALLQRCLPVFEPKHLRESEYPVSFNGKMRFTIELPLDLTKDQIEEIIMKDERTIKQLEGRTPNKVIIVPGKSLIWLGKFLKITIVKIQSNYWGLIYENPIMNIV
jgi:leucyl-tRNA synthetase